MIGENAIRQKMTIYDWSPLIIKKNKSCHWHNTNFACTQASKV
jgi:hypothetical protein